jgi:cell division protein FtsB
LIVAEKRQYQQVYSQREYIEKDDRRQIQQKRRLRSRNKARAVGRVVIAFAVAVVLISRFAIISEYNYAIGQLEKELQQLKNSNERLGLMEAQAQDIDFIEEYAITQLGMVYPDNRDIIFVAVEDTPAVNAKSADVTEQEDGAYETEGWVAAVVGRFNSIFD